MSYRDENEALRAHIQVLEERLRKLDGRAQRVDAVDRTRSNAILGGPYLIVLERDIEGEVPDEAIEDMVALLHQDLGRTGRVDRIGRTVTWTLEQSDDQLRTFNVSVRRRHGRTSIRLTEHLGALAGGLFGGIVGGVGGGSLGLWIPLAVTGVLHPLAAIGGFGVGLAALWTAVRTGFGATARGRRERLHDLLDRVVELFDDALEEAGPGVAQVRVQADEAPELGERAEIPVGAEAERVRRA